MNLIKMVPFPLKQKHKLAIKSPKFKEIKTMIQLHLRLMVGVLVGKILEALGEYS